MSVFSLEEAPTQLQPRQWSPRLWASLLSLCLLFGVYRNSMFVKTLVYRVGLLWKGWSQRSGKRHFQLPQCRLALVFVARRIIVLNWQLSSGIPSISFYRLRHLAPRAVQTAACTLEAPRGWRQLFHCEFFLLHVENVSAGTWLVFKNRELAVRTVPETCLCLSTQKIITNQSQGTPKIQTGQLWVLILQMGTLRSLDVVWLSHAC